MKSVTVDFNRTIGRIKPLHGVNNGCLTRIFTNDTSEFFKEAGIPYARLHDTEYPYGGGEFVDISCIFKNFDADPENPASYNFDHTDAYLKAIIDSGTQIVYRLGNSIENFACKHTPKHINPPKDNLKWAKICEGIIKHYNEGWADGFYWNIKYWEIWNEPESGAMWTGTKEQFYDLYCVAAKYLKEKFPEIKIGGYGSIGFYSLSRPNDAAFQREPYLSLVEYMRGFFSEAKKANVPIDFFSWHIYSNDPDEYTLFANEAANLLNEYGYQDGETLLTEWNMDVGRQLWRIKSLEGAAHATSVFCALQKTPLNLAMYYLADPNNIYYCGLFDEGKPIRKTKTFYAFEAFNELYKLGDEVKVETDNGLYILAARGSDEAAVLVTNYKGEPCTVEITVSEFSSSNGVEISTYYINDEHNLEVIKKELTFAEKYSVYNTLAENNVILLKLKKL